MATFNYSRSQATAERLIAKFGTSGAIRRTVSTADPNSTPWNPGDDTQTTTDYACTLVVMNYAVSQIDGTLIQKNDRKVYVSTDALSVTPTTSDAVVASGVEFQIISVKPLNPAGTVIYYEIQARA